MKKNIHHILIAILLGGTISRLWAISSEAYYSYLLGVYLGQKGDLPAAVYALKHCRQIDPQASYPLRELALYQWQLGQTQAAEESIKLYNQENPDDVSAQLFIGSFYILTGQTELATQHLEKVLRLDPKNGEAKLYLASIYASSDTSRSVEYLEKYLVENPQDAEVSYQLGRLLEEKNPQRARQLYEKAIASQPPHLLALLSLAQLLEKTDPEKAINYYQQYLQLSPDDNAVRIYLGGFYYRQKNYPAAKKIFQEAQKNSPETGLADFWLAMIALEEKDPDEAIKYLQASLKKDQSYLAMIQLANVYIQKNNYSQAVQTLKKTIKYLQKNISLSKNFEQKISSTTFPALLSFTSGYYSINNERLADTYFLLGLVYLDKHNYSSARKSFQQTLALKPDFSDAHFYLATLYDGKKNWPEAEKELLLAVHTDSNNAAALNYLGYSWTERKKNLAQAYEFIARAVDLQPENGAYLDSLGWWYHQTGDYSTAEKYLKRAIEKMPEAEIYEHLAKNSEKLLRPDEAYLYWRQAQQIKPDRKYLQQIKRLEKNLRPGTPLRKSLKLIEGNNLQIKNFSAIVSVEIPLNIFRTWRALAFLKYQRDNYLGLEFSGPFFLPSGYLYYYDNGRLENNLEKSSAFADYQEVITVIYKFFNSSLLRDFDRPETTTKPPMVFSHNQQTLILSPKNSWISSYQSPDLKIQFSNYQMIDGLFVPGLITATLPQQKIIIRMKKIAINQAE